MRVGCSNLFCSILFLSHSALAAERMSFDDALKKIESSNQTLLSSKSSLDAANADLWSARGHFLPALKSSASYAKEKSEDSPTYTAGLTLTQNLFRGFGDLALNEKARLNHTLSQIALEMTRSKLRAEVKFQYGQTLIAKNVVELAKLVQSRRANMYRMVELRYMGGRENYGSVLFVKAQAEEANLDGTESEYSYAQSVRALKKLLNDDSPESLELVTALDELLAPFEVPSHQPLEMNQVNAQQSLKGADLRIARSQFFPELNFSVDYGRRGPEFFPQSASTTVLATVSLNLFNGTQDYFNYRRARALEISTSMSSRDALREVSNRIAQKKESLDLTKKLATLAIQFRKAAETRVEVARKKYSNGLMSFDELEIIETDFINREKSELQSKKNWLQALTQLELEFETNKESI
jgi:outer membrane protein TolC